MSKKKKKPPLLNWRENGKTDLTKSRKDKVTDDTDEADDSNTSEFDQEMESYGEGERYPKNLMAGDFVLYDLREKVNVISLLDK